MWRLWTFTCLQRISSKIEGPMFLAGGFNMSSSHSVILNGNNYLKFDQNRNYLKTDGSHQCRVSTRMMIRQIWNYQGTHLLDFFFTRQWSLLSNTLTSERPTCQRSRWLRVSPNMKYKNQWVDVVPKVWFPWTGWVTSARWPAWHLCALQVQWKVVYDPGSKASLIGRWWVTGSSGVFTLALSKLDGCCVSGSNQKKTISI